MNYQHISFSHSQRLLCDPVLSIVVPFYNEALVLPQLLERLTAVGETLNLPYELIFIDDGSVDGGAEFLAKVARFQRRIQLIQLTRNFGKEAALTAGIDHARGAAVVIIDADLQDPPELIPDMVAAWRGGADVVLMQRRTRAGETFFKRMSAHCYYRLLNRMSDCQIPKDVGDFRLLNRRAVDALKSLPERNRYMKGLFAWIGMNTRTLPYDRDPRAAGASKWDYLSLFRLALEGISSFSVAPLHWSAFVGALSACLGGLFGVWIVLKAMLLGEPVQGYPSLIAVITFLGGCQLMTIGILGQYVGKTYLESKQRPTYLVQRHLGSRRSEESPSWADASREVAAHD